jgi:hypothetical protein
LGGKDTFQKFNNDVRYFIGSQLSGDDLTFKNEYVIGVYISNVDAFTIAFDEVNGRHPNSIRIGDTTYYVDDALFTVAGLSYQGFKTYVPIYISNWNTPNSPLVISGIYVNLSINVNKTNIISIDASLFSKSDIKKPSYGIYSSSGNISFKDIDGEIADYAEQRLLTSNSKVELFLENTLANCSQKVAEFYTAEWQYDALTKEANVTMKDELEEWQDINVEGFIYDPRTPFKTIRNGSFRYLYDWLHKATPSKYRMISYNELDESTRNVLSNTKISYPYLKEASLWNQWQKVCEVCKSYIYKDNQGKTIFKYLNGG